MGKGIGITQTRENRLPWSEACAVLHCASQVSHGLARDIPGVTAVSGRRISAWGLHELKCRRWFKCKFGSYLAKTYHVCVTNVIHLNVLGQWWLFLWTTRLNNHIWEKCCVLQHSSSWNDYYCWLIGQIPSYVSVHLTIRSVYLVIHIFPHVRWLLPLKYRHIIT